MTTQPTPEQLAKAHQEAEDYLREKYGAYRGHFAWRELEYAYTTAYLRAKQENEQAIKDARKQLFENFVIMLDESNIYLEPSIYAKLKELLND